VEFYDIFGHVLLSTNTVTVVQGAPTDGVVSEDGNVLVLTENSAYEVDQEQKLFRRLAGINSPTQRVGLDGEWTSYHSMVLHEGKQGRICYDGTGKYTLTSTIREIRGTLVEPPVSQPNVV
jgi:hypothetical protein